MAAQQAADRKTLELIKKIIHEETEKLGVTVEKVILFGSRARGDYRPDSDYDILVVVKGRLDRRLKIELMTNIGSRLIDALGAPVDVVVVSEAQWRRYHAHPGTVMYPASREGITVV